MNSLNKVQIIGNLTADPEIRETPNGQKVATCSVATNRTWKDAAGAKQEQVEYHNIVFWARLADIVEQYLMKGKKVYIEGRLQTRSWDAQDGTKRYRTEIVCENLIMLSSSQGMQSGGNFAQAPPPPGDDDFPRGAATASSDDESSEKKPKRGKKKDDEEISIEDIPF